MTASLIDPINLEHRLTTLEVSQAEGFTQLQLLLSSEASSLRQSIDSLTREVGKQNERVTSLETWRITKDTRDTSIKSEQTGRTKLIDQAWKITSETVKIAVALGLVTFIGRVLGG